MMIVSHELETDEASQQIHGKMISLLLRTFQCNCLYAKVKERNVSDLEKKMIPDLSFSEAFLISS